MEDETCSNPRTYASSNPEAATLRDVYNDMRCYYERTIDDLQQCVCDKQMELMRALGNKDKFQENEQYLQCKLDECSEALQKKQKDLREMAEQYTNKIKLMENEIIQLSQRVKDLTDMNHFMAKRMDEAVSKAEQADKEKCDCEVHLHALQCQLEAKEQQIKELEVYRDKSIKLEAQLLDATQQLTECQLKYEAKKEKVNSLLEELDKLTHDFEEQLTQKDEYIASLQNQMKKCKEDWAECQKQLAKYQEEIVELKSQNAEIPFLRKQLEDCQNLMQEAASLKAEVQRLRDKLGEVEKRAAEELARLKAQMARDLDKGKEAIQENIKLKQQVALLRDQLKLMDGLARECACLRNQNRCFQDRMSNLERILEERTVAIRENDRKVVCLNATIEENNKTICCLQDYINRQSQLEKDRMKISHNERYQNSYC